jgi:hypothetical protein
MVALLGMVLLFSASDSSGARHFSGSSITGNDYEDAVRGAGHAEGDIWGGEQGSDPEVTPFGPVVGESMPVINTLPKGGKLAPDPVPNGGQAGWIYQLARFFEWLGVAPSFSKL